MFDAGNGPRLFAAGFQTFAEWDGAGWMFYPSAGRAARALEIFQGDLYLGSLSDWGPWAPR